ncbi:MAG: hypothetical protein P8L83_07400 [Flavobacteriaceae bacterium]|nr:hypothetical protein [Flavobacteriaceae bacterium]
MGRIAGKPNKLTAEVKEKLQVLVDDVIDKIDISKLDDNQKIKLLQIGIQYIVPRLKHSSNDDNWHEQPLFPTHVDIITRDDNDEWAHDVRPLKQVN